MKIGLVGATYQANSLPFDAQRTVNLYPVLDQMGKEISALYGTPGLLLFGTAGVGAVRGMFAATNGRVFIVSGSTFYEIDNAGAVTNYGSLLQSSGIVSIAENGLQLCICDGIKLYIFTYSSNTFAVVSDADLPSVSTVTFLDGYFIASKNSSGSFYISALYDGASWAALDFATAESSPDNLLRVYNALGQLWLMGDTTSEVWTNTGASAFPFQKIAGANIETGILAPHTTVALDNSLFWVGKDRFGQGMVYRASGFTPTRISTEPIELLIQAATNTDEIRGYAYQDQGHVFYVLTGGGLETTLVYDLTTEQWHERAYLSAEGVYEQHRGSCGVFAFGKQLVGDRENGNIYQLDMNTYTDNGDAILRERIYTHLSNEGKYMRFKSLEIGFETGVGLQNGQGSNPLVALQLSKDGAKTWSTTFTTTIGAVGQYQTSVMFNRLGVARQMTFRIKISDPVKIAICGSYLL